MGQVKKTNFTSKNFLALMGQVQFFLALMGQVKKFYFISKKNLALMGQVKKFGPHGPSKFKFFLFFTWPMRAKNFLLVKKKIFGPHGPSNFFFLKKKKKALMGHLMWAKKKI